MYQPAINVTGGRLDEALYEMEAQASGQSYYYWLAYHKPSGPGSAWQLKEMTKAELHTSFGASNRQVQFSNDWFQRLGLSGGWLYIARFKWNGTSWDRDRCNMRDLVSAQIYPC